MKAGFELDITGHETGGRLLKISARGKPDSLDSVVASIEAANFDIAPFLAFAPPGPTVGMRGLVSGVLKLRGLDPQTGDVRGRLVISEVRVPLAAELGTLRSGLLEIDIVKKEVHAKLDGKIGRGTVKGKALLRLTGSMPTAAELTLALRKVSPIGEIQPVIDATSPAGSRARARSGPASSRSRMATSTCRPRAATSCSARARRATSCSSIRSRSSSRQSASRRPRRG